MTTSILIPPTLTLILPSSCPIIININASKRSRTTRGRRRRPNLRSSLKKAFSFAKFLTNLSPPQTTDPLNLLYLLIGSGGGGGGGPGFLGGSSGGEWWGNGRRGQRNGLIALLSVLAMIAILGAGEKEEWGRMARVLVPGLVAGLKLRVWRKHYWMGILFLFFGVGVLLFQLRGRKMRLF